MSKKLPQSVINSVRKRNSFHFYALERAGGTIVTYVLKKSFKMKAIHRVVTTHHNKYPIVVFRDFRDIIVSRWRVGLSVRQDKEHFKEKKISHKEYIKQAWSREKYLETLEKGMSKIEIDKLLDPDHRTPKQITQLNELFGIEGVLYLRYEDFYDNVGYILDSVEDNFDMKIENKEQIIKECSIDSIIERTKNYGHFRYWDKQGFHGDHISEKRGKPGTWKKYIKGDLQEYITEKLKEDLERWGYKWK